MHALLSDIPSMKSDLPRNFKDGAGRWFYLSFIICVEWNKGNGVEWNRNLSKKYASSDTSLKL